MRQLIRPTLCMFARLGLFFAVVVWIVGHWWLPFLETPRGVLAAAPQGWVIIIAEAEQWDAGVVSTIPNSQEDDDEPSITQSAFTFPNDGTMALSASTGFSLGGLTYQHFMLFWIGAPLRTIALRHWLIVIVFALFYGVLKWVYRKRPEAQPCEV